MENNLNFDRNVARSFWYNVIMDVRTRYLVYFDDVGSNFLDSFDENWVKYGIGMFFVDVSFQNWKDGFVAQVKAFRPQESYLGTLPEGKRA